MTGTKCWTLGSTSGFALVMNGLGREIVFVDVNRARAQAEVNDILDAVSFAHPLLVRAGEYAGLVDSQIVIIAAGVAQGPGETRLQLLQRNAAVFEQVHVRAEAVASSFSPSVAQQKRRR